MTERPPLLKGSTQEQVNALRDYLFKLAASLDKASGAQTVQDSAVVTMPDGSKALKKRSGGGSSEEIQKVAAGLRALIIKSAEEVEAYADRKVETYGERFVASSEFGALRESIQAQIETTARGVVESYGLQSDIESALDGIGQLRQLISGEIRRGIVQDPSTGEYVTGIAISQRMEFQQDSQTGADRECGPSDPLNPGDGFTYYYLAANQTFGLYTSTGWQFWIGGARVGWFDSVDGMLHVGNAAIEQDLRIDGWLISSAGGLGIRKG